MADLTYRQALAQNELVASGAGAGQENIDGTQVISATGASPNFTDSGFTFNSLKSWVKLDADWMSKSTYDTGGTGRVDNAEQLNDGSNVVTAAQARGHINDSTIHFTIDDSSTATNVTWSANKISNELGNKADGDVYGPGSSVAGNLAVFSDTSGKQLADATYSMPAGGTIGQVLGKASNSDYDWAWIDQTGSGGWDGNIEDIDIAGGTDIGSDLADEDLFIVDDGASGTNRKSTLSRVWTYVYNKIASASTTALQIGTHKESLYAVTTTGNITLDLANGMTQRVTLDANRQITLPADPAAFGQTFQLFIDCASFTPTWASTPTIKWLTDDQSPPTLDTTSGAVNVLIFTWDDSYNTGAGAWFGQYSNYASAP